MSKHQKRRYDNSKTVTFLKDFNSLPLDNSNLGFTVSKLLFSKSLKKQYKETSLLTAFNFLPKTTIKNVQQMTNVHYHIFLCLILDLPSELKAQIHLLEIFKNTHVIWNLIWGVEWAKLSQSKIRSQLEQSCLTLKKGHVEKICDVISFYGLVPIDRTGTLSTGSKVSAPLNILGPIYSLIHKKNRWEKKTSLANSTFFVDNRR